MRRRKPTDAEGEVLKAGDRVRILGVPDLSAMSTTARAKSFPVFQHLVSTVKRID